jgi:hypothetical protein
MEDVELMSRIRKRGDRICILDERASSRWICRYHGWFRLWRAEGKDSRSDER